MLVEFASDESRDLKLPALNFFIFPSHSPSQHSLASESLWKLERANAGLTEIPGKENLLFVSLSHVLRDEGQLNPPIPKGPEPHYGRLRRATKQRSPTFSLKFGASSTVSDHGGLKLCPASSVGTTGNANEERNKKAFSTYATMDLPPMLTI
jgi:hypothetical protein